MRSPLRQEITKLIRNEVAPATGLSSANNGNILYRCPTEWILTGYTFDWVPEAFYVYAFAKALFVPSSNLLGVSTRLPIPGTKMQRWPPRWRPALGSSDDQLVAAISTAVNASAPFVDSTSSLSGFLSYVETLDPDRLSPLLQEQVVYGRILVGLSAIRGKAQLRSLHALVARTDGRPAFKEVLERANVIERAVDITGTPIEIFSQWKIANLTTLDIRTP